MGMMHVEEFKKLMFEQTKVWSSLLDDYIRRMPDAEFKNIPIIGNVERGVISSYGWVLSILRKENEYWTIYLMFPSFFREETPHFIPDKKI